MRGRTPMVREARVVHQTTEGLWPQRYGGWRTADRRAPISAHDMRYTVSCVVDSTSLSTMKLRTWRTPGR